MLRLCSAAPLLALALISAPVMAGAADSVAVPTAQQLADMSDKQLDAAMAKADKANEAGGFAGHCIMAAIDTEMKRRGRELKPGALQTSEGLCAFHNNDFGIAKEKLAELEQLKGDSANPEFKQAIDSLILFAASASKDNKAFEQHAGHISARNWPKEFSAQSEKSWPFLLRDLDDEEAAGRVALKFAQASSFPYLPAKVQKLMSYRAVRPAILTGNTELAAELALREPSTYALLSQLIDRDFEAIWPQLEAGAGPHVSKALATELARTTEAARLAPNDRAKQTALASTLLYTRDYAGVVRLAAQVDHSKSNADKLREDDAWMLNTEARAFDLLGRRSEADAIFDLLATLDPEMNDRGWLVNFAINRADRLVGQGRWKEGLSAAELAVSVAAKHGSAYAKEVAAVDRYCAAIKLDPSKPELADWWSEIDKNFKENIGSAVQAAECKGDRAAAVRFLSAGLEDVKTRQSTVLVLQPRAFDLYRDEANMFAEPRLLLESDPALKALFLKYGRELPAGLLPL